MPPKTWTLTPTLILDRMMHIWSTAAASLNQTRGASIAETEQAVPALDTQFPTKCAGFAYSLTVSPDQNWLANDCWRDHDFQITKRDGSVTWNVTYSELYPPPLDSNMLGGVKPLHWTDDSKYLYFTTTYCCVDTDAISQDQSLYRLDVQTGDWIEEIPGYFNYYSFSPAGSRLIYVPDEQTNGKSAVINIINLETGANTYIPLNGYEQAAWAYWRKDGKAFAITAKNGGIYSTRIEEFAIALVDIETKSVKLIIKNLNDNVQVTNWKPDNILTLEITKYIEPFGEVPEDLYYNILSNKFINPTPIP